MTTKAKIKFTRETILDRNYKGSKETRWWFKPTKYLPRGYAINEGYTWEVYDEDGNCYTNYKRYHNRLRSRADAVEFIANYDARYEAQLEYEREEKERLERQANEQLAKEAEYLEFIKMDVENPAEIEVNETYYVKTFNLSKLCNFGEGATSNATYGRGKVAKVVRLSNEDFDKFVSNLYRAPTEYFLDCNGIAMGGDCTDHPDLQDVEYMKIVNDPKLLQLFRDTSYGEIIAFTAPNRNPVQCNPQGYNYARYVGTFA